MATVPSPFPPDGARARSVHLRAMLSQETRVHHRAMELEWQASSFLKAEQMVKEAARLEEEGTMAQAGLESKGERGLVGAI